MKKAKKKAVKKVKKAELKKVKGGAIVKAYRPIVQGNDLACLPAK